MNLAVIEKDDFAAFQSRSEHFLNEENHRFAVNRAGDAQGSTHPHQAHGADGRKVPFVISRNFLDHPFSRRGARIKPRHRQMRTHLINEHTGWDPLCRSSGGTASPVFRRVPGRINSFFRGKPSSCKARQIVAWLTETPRLSTSACCSSTSEASGCAAMCSRKTVCPGSLSEGSGPTAMTWRQIVSCAVQSQHLFDKGHADVKQSGNFGNRMLSLFNSGNNTDSQFLRLRGKVA